MNDLGTGFPKEKAEQRPSGRLDVEPAAASPDPVVELHKQRTIGGVIRVHADVRPERPAIVASQFALLSYRELQDQIDAVRTYLRQAGFGRDARIAVAIANSPEAALAIVAIACSAAAVPLDPKLTVAEVERRLGGQACGGTARLPRYRGDRRSTRKIRIAIGGAKNRGCLIP
jgi:non-ribosomal peptide synthetase component F